MESPILEKGSGSNETIEKLSANEMKNETTEKPELTPPPDRSNDRQGEVTTIWGSGEVIRVKPNGKTEQRNSVPAVE